MRTISNLRLKLGGAFRHGIRSRDCVAYGIIAKSETCLAAIALLSILNFEQDGSPPQGKLADTRGVRRRIGIQAPLGPLGSGASDIVLKSAALQTISGKKHV